MKWISVEDELPEDGEEVLCYSVGHSLNYDVLYRSQGEWWRSMDGIWNMEVVKWMHIPEDSLDK